MDQEKGLEEELKSKVGEIIVSVVGNAQYDEKKSEIWADEVLKQTYALAKIAHYKVACLVEIFPKESPYLKKMKHLSIPGTDVVSLITKKMEHATITVFLVMMCYE
mmetsp:Transcript_25368/g.45084  ORF Transcript_25368/g.45084 Transcript_25368/m.45084 type:complete len:106 (-) Transcript_25368:367-684(-)